MRKWMFGALALCGIWYFWPGKQPVKNAGRPVQTLVAFGDSLTAGYGAGGPQHAYPAQLAQLSGKTVINLGKSGETAVQALARVRDVLDKQPDMVLIEFGANDHMQHLDFQHTVSAVAQITEAVQQAGAVAVLIDTAGPGMGAYTKAYKQLAREKHALFVPGIVRNIFYKKALKSDLIHPNAAGYKIIAKDIYSVIKPYL